MTSSKKQRHLILLKRLTIILWDPLIGLIKAGAKLIGKSAGDVRPPLTMPTEKEIEELRSIIAQND